MHALKDKIRKGGTLPLCPEDTDHIMTNKANFDDASSLSTLKSSCNADSKGWQMEGAHI